jgi:2-polyprenyl-3-methyl-5-hydroxy-6-metoxy-1,4-benzoquinol methylase
MLRKKHRLIARLTRKKKLLDIGCGTGYFLSYMKKHSYDVMGIEKNSVAKEFAVKNFKLKIKPPEDLLNGTIKKQFDIITLWHVLEHLYNPQIYLKMIHELLHDDGILLIALPNHHSFDAAHYKDKWAAYDLPRHLWHFTPETLKSFAEKCKFEIKALKGLHFDPFYNSLLSAKYKSKYIYFFSGVAIGFISYLTGLLNTKKCSSITYILKKK